MLQQVTDQRPQSTCNFELISDDSLASKTFHLGMQANLKLSFFTGLVSTAGSAKYLNDCKSSNKLQARVTLKYSSTTRFEELAIEKLGAVCYPKVRGKATHIVTGVLYGADAFFVFDQEVAPSENYQAVHENMKKVIKSLPDTVTVTDMTKVQCTVYCDFQLPENPTSFQDAAKCLKELPRLADSSTSAVPKRVHLFPLNKLDSSAAKIAHEISPALVTETESFMEMFHELQMQCNGIMKMEVSSKFPAILRQLSRFQQTFTLYKCSMTKELAGLVTRVRGGETQEADMSKVFIIYEDSPFHSQRMLSWLSKKEREVTVLTSYLKSMKGIQFVASPNELDAIVSNFEYDFVLCFSFLVTDEHDAYLQCLSDYLRAPQLKQKFDDAMPQHWHEDRTVVRDMRSQARQFKDFAEANRMQQRTTFIVSSCANLENSGTKCAITVLFRDGLPEKFTLPSQPGKATSTMVTNDSILIAWGSPKCGAESVQSYTISYRVENDPAEQWKIKRTQDSGNTTMIAQLTPNTKYLFKVHTQCEVGVSPDSEISDPIETRPNTPYQDGDEMQVSSKPVVSYPAVFNSKVPISRPGKPNASKVTSNSIHLNWHTPESDIQSIEFYSVQYRRIDDLSSQWDTVKTQGAKEFAEVSGLAAKAVYCFKVRAECESGVSPDSEMSDPVVTADPSPVLGRPGKPTASKVTHNSIHLKWPGPKSGVDGVQFYTVIFRRMDDPLAEWQNASTHDSQNEVTVSGLVANAVYCFKVRAECVAGVSPDSEMSDPIATSHPPVPGRPGKPTASKVTHNSIHLNWPGPKSGIECVKFYTVIYHRMDDPLAEWQTTKTQDFQKDITLSGLVAKAVYSFKVHAESEAGISPDSEMSDPIRTSPPPVPGRPGKPTASKVTHNSIHLNWPGPKSGIEGVKCYSVIYRRMDDASADWQTTKTMDSQREVIVSGLAAKAAYCFKVRAECEADVSPDSEMSDPIVTSTPPLPGRPGTPTASKVTHNSIHINWSGPISGFESVNYYLVLYRRMDDPSAEWQTIQTQDSQKQLKVSGLAAKVVYCFKVCTVSEAGAGPKSDMSEPIRTMSPPKPGRPGKPTASKVTHNSIDLNWPGPESGFENVKFYSVFYCRLDDPSAEWQTAKTLDSQEEVTVGGLAAKTVYYFKVRAECESGVSPESELSEPTATSAPPVPGRPGKPTPSKVTHNSIHLNWPGPQLAPKTKYPFRVHAQCHIGRTLESELSDPIETSPKYPHPHAAHLSTESVSYYQATSKSRPGKPNASKVTSDTIHLNWRPPESGTQHIESYSVSYRRVDKPSQWWTTKTHNAQEFAEVSGLAAKAAYCFKVCAEYQVGTSLDSEVSDSIVTRPALPGKPGKPKAAKVTHNSIQLHWPGPEFEFESNIEFYSVLYRPMNNPSTDWKKKKTNGAIKAITLSGLKENTSYIVKVCAGSEAGVGLDSEMSNPIITNPPPLPDRPDPIATNPHPVPGKPGRPMTSNVTHNSIQLTWSGPESGFPNIKSYTVLYRRIDDPSSQWQTQSTQGAQAMATLSGLAAKTTYYFKIRAEGETGVCSDSEMSNFITTNPHPIPGKPGRPMTSNVTHNSIQLTWSGPESGFPNIKSYTVLYRRIDNPSSQWQTQSTQGAQAMATVSGLAAKTMYYFKIRAVGETGVCSDSEMSNFITTNPHPIPGKPGRPMTSNVTHNSIQLTWSGPESVIRDIKSYTVLYRRMDDPLSQWQEQDTQEAKEVAMVSGLSAHVMYCFKVRAECENGASIESEMSELVATRPSPFSGRPGKPNATKVTHNTVDLIWAPLKHGAENVKCYSVFYRQANSPAKHWEVKRTGDTKLRLVVSNLVPNTRYCFKVCAESDAGISLESQVNSDIQTHPLDVPPLCQPGKPYIFAVINDKIILKWDQPSFGAKEVKFYTVSYCAEEDHDFPHKWMTMKSAGPTESVIVSGLTPSILYCFKVRAESDAGCSSYSISSGPIQLHAPPAPSQPGEPTASGSDITHNSILLAWAKPEQGGDYVKHYSISYRKQCDPVDQWQTRLSDGARTALSVGGLDPKTEHCFKVQAVSDSGTSTDSEVSTFQTNEMVRLAEEMLSSAIKMEQGPPAIYKLNLQEDIVDQVNQIKKCSIGNADPLTSAEEKVIMVLGATGAGKSTLINGMVNYFLGVQWEDGFRFKVITDGEIGCDTVQAHSQTKWITAYTFHHHKGSPLPYTLTIIDTPGFGDTGGLERDHRITEQIKRFFSTPLPDGIDHLDAIGFVTQAALARLTPTQKYIFDSILAIFGKDIVSNLFMMATFADGGDPPVMTAIKAANIPFCNLFAFNNSSLYASCSDMFAKMFWVMGVASFEAFFVHLLTAETRSLCLTRVVLDERVHLEAIMQGLLPKIKTIMSIMDELQQEENYLERLQLESSDLGRKKFTYTVRTVRQKRVDLPAGKYITNCSKCNRTCHYPCKVPDDARKWSCAAMNWKEAGKRSVCQVCPGGCEWQLHSNNTYLNEDFEVHKVKTLDDLLKKFKTVRSDKDAVKNVVHIIQQKVKNLKRKVFEMICEAQQILARLNEIALKPNSLTEMDYIDLLIENEKQECKPGYAKRLEYLQEVRHNAELIHQMDEPVYAPQWLKESVQKVREQMIRHRHVFQQQEPNPYHHDPLEQPTARTKQDASTRQQMTRHQHPLQAKQSYPYLNPISAQPLRTRQDVSTREQTDRHPLQWQHSDSAFDPIPLQSTHKGKQGVSTRELTNRQPYPLQQQHSYSDPLHAQPPPASSTRRASTDRELRPRQHHSSQQQHPKIYPVVKEPTKSTGGWWPFRN